MKLVSLPNPAQFQHFNRHQAQLKRAANLLSLLTSGQLPHSPAQPSNSSLLGLEISLESLKDHHNLSNKPQHKVRTYTVSVIVVF